MTEPVRRGRRPGGEDTRAAIIEASLVEFATAGYAATSLRGIARRAGVDPRLVHHYFEGKAALFAEIMHVPVNPAGIVASVVDGDPDSLGERIVRTFLSVWDDPERQAALVALIRTGIDGSPEAPQLRDYITEDVVGRIVRAHPGAAGLPTRERQLRASLIATQMLGLAIGRYVLHLPELAGAPAEDIVGRIGPILQRHLTP